MLLSICKATANKITKTNTLLKNFSFYSEVERLRNFLQAYSLFYGLVQNSVLLKENARLRKQIDNSEKVEKSISEIHYENSLIAAKIQDQEKELAAMKDSKKDPIFSDFLFDFYSKVVRNHDLIKR